MIATPAALALALLATVNPMTRDDILSRGAGGLGFSYYWGHGSWLPGHAGDSPGTCSGDCPSCTHTGQYGADCSGFVCKAWAMPSSNGDVTVDEHPYSTADLILAKAGYWAPPADASDVRPGDARVFRDATHGHTYLVRQVTGAGRFTTLEAKGCAYGILSITRSDAWTTQRRAQIIEPPPQPPGTPETPNGAAALTAGQSAAYCTLAITQTGGLVTDTLLARASDGGVIARANAPAALSGAEMCAPLAFPAAGHYGVSAIASNDAGASAESSPLAVVVTAADAGSGGGGSIGGSDGGSTDAGGSDAGTSHDGGSIDAGSQDAGALDAGSADAGVVVDDADAGQDDGDGTGAPILITSRTSCGCNGGGDAGPLAALGLWLVARLRRRRQG